MNIYTFTGRLARDCEQRFTQSGMAICSFTVAVDAGYGDKKTTNWIRCNLFGKRAEGGLPQYLVKGAQVAVSGELKVNEYEDKEGNKRTSIDVNVDKLDLVGGASSERGSQYNMTADEARRKEYGNAYEGKPVDPFADQPDFNAAPVDDDIPF